MPKKWIQEVRECIARRTLKKGSSASEVMRSRANFAERMRVIASRRRARRHGKG